MGKYSSKEEDAPQLATEDDQFGSRRSWTRYMDTERGLPSKTMRRLQHFARVPNLNNAL